ncbi:MAG: four helix bundle protein [Myxococcota bacterium]
MFRFKHETLDAYRLSVECVHWFREAHWPRGTSHLKDQGCRAMDSVALNIAEGIARGRRATAAGRNHLSIAVGSAAEACAVLDLVHLEGGAEIQEKLRRVGIMLLRLGGG